MEAIMLTVRKQGPNTGRLFYKCQANGGSGVCNFLCGHPMALQLQLRRMSIVRYLDRLDRVLCDCNLPAVERTVSRKGPNMGRKFYCCPKPMGEGCRFFKWADERRMYKMMWMWFMLLNAQPAFPQKTYLSYFDYSTNNALSHKESNSEDLNGDGPETILVDFKFPTLNTTGKFSKTAVTTTIISNYHFMTIERGTFDGFSNLKFLHLLNGKLESLPDRFLHDLPKLYSVSLRRNNIKSLPDELFLNLNGLNRLQLNNNQLNRIQNDAFKGAPNLETINLSHNDLTDLEPNALRGLRNLKTVDLSNNHLEKLPTRLFGDNPKLSSIHLHNNLIKVIDGEVFTSLKDLVTLNLNENSIDEIHPSAFFDLVSIKEINLEINAVTELHRDHFKNLGSLSTLNLKNNRISELPPDIFKNLSGLSHLKLTNNKLEALSPRAFIGLSNLTNLNLDGNRIKFIKEGSFFGLDGCQHLSLADNEIEELVSGAFKGAPFILHLFLNNNNGLKKIHDGALADLEYLYVLGLENTMVEDLDFVKELPSLSLIWLKGTKFENATSFTVGKRMFTLSYLGHWDVN